MKWTNVPSVDLDVFSDSRICIIGVGSLGCQMVISLLAWGCNKYSFVDNGTVGYSNVVRQSLFDVSSLGKPKVFEAKNRLLNLDPRSDVNAVVLDVPMPGHHRYDDQELTQTVTQLEDLVENCEVLLILTDSREARWLPTLLPLSIEKTKKEKFEKTKKKKKKKKKK
eukprot:Trichotokara_eunicae@DN3888_c0_g1_i1.p1